MIVEISNVSVFGEKLPVSRQTGRLQAGCCRAVVQQYKLSGQRQWLIVKGGCQEVWMWNEWSRLLVGRCCRVLLNVSLCNHKCSNLICLFTVLFNCTGFRNAAHQASEKNEATLLHVLSVTLCNTDPEFYKEFCLMSVCVINICTVTEISNPIWACTTVGA